MTSKARREALSHLAHPSDNPAKADSMASDFTASYGEDVFTREEMERRIPKKALKELDRITRAKSDLSPELADAVAHAMKEWALSKGVTHFTHWFQPMTGLTAEKHDSFLDLDGAGQVVTEFSGKQLVKGEPDASSFPSGGLRATFEARGYTAWDPTSPAFIRRGTEGATLCIPTAFCSWTGEALDKKTPLMRSVESVEREAKGLITALGLEAPESIHPTLGTEQEYFLIDRAFFLARPDMVATGRTLLGARPPKGQELEDRYFGTISTRVMAYMEDVEQQLWRLGVPVKTRHNEVAPSQFELAPVFEPVTVAVDHNMVTMDVLRKTAEKHGLVCLLHEKPFAGVNGSGKHCNWSLATSAGENLLEPGRTPSENTRFLVFLAAVVKAVDEAAGLLRFSIANAGNDHRLGANEAPPAIISMYLGEELGAIVESLIKGDEPTSIEHKAMRLGVSSIPPLPRDNTDRNRTSPFAFTGNKFEFRAVGSSQSVARPNTLINASVAAACRDLAQRIEALSGEHGRDTAITTVVRETLQKHHRVIFGGNNYSQEWEQEAERRGLPNLRDTVDSLAQFTDEKHVQMLESVGVYTRRELESSSNVAYENYAKAILIEAQSTLGLATTAVLPAGLEQQRRAAQSLQAIEAVGIQAQRQRDLLGRLSSEVETLIETSHQLQNVYEEMEGMDEEEQLVERAHIARDRVIPAMNAVRDACDTLETLVDDSLWPLPKYREMLFCH